MTIAIRLASAAALTAASLLFGCGPAALGVGAASVAGDDDQQVVFLVLVNDGDELLQLALDGRSITGDAFDVDALRIAPGGTSRLELQTALQALRVRGAEDPAAGANRVPATWDLAVTDLGAGATVRLGLESALAASLPGSQPGENESFAMRRLTLDATTGGPTFATVTAADLGVDAGLVALHPAGGYVYTVEDLGSGAVELRSFRVDALTGEVGLIGPEFGRAPVNPRVTTISGAFADLALVIEPRARFAYLMDRDPAANSTALTVFEIAADGSLTAPAFGQRGLVADLAFRADGAIAFLVENVGTAATPAFELQSLTVREDGTFSVIRTETMPCVVDVAPRLAVHPSNGLVYVAFRDDSSDFVKLGAYFLDPFGGVTLIDTRCSDVRTLEDLEFDPTGQFLYITGTAPDPANAALSIERALRYPIDTNTGSFGALAVEQDFGDVSNLARTSDPTRSRSDPLRDIVYVAIDDRLVPHVRLVTGELREVPGDASLPFGSPSSTRLLQGVVRGCATVQRP